MPGARSARTRGGRRAKRPLRRDFAPRRPARRPPARPRPPSHPAEFLAGARAAPRRPALRTLRTPRHARASARARAPNFPAATIRLPYCSLIAAHQARRHTCGPFVRNDPSHARNCLNCSATRENPHLTLRSDGQRNGNEGHARASEGLIVVIVVTSSASANKELFEAFECQTRASPGARSSREIDFVRNDAELPWGWGEAGLGHPRRPRDPFGFPQGCLSTYLGQPP